MRALVAAAVLLLPTVCMGLTFPLLLGRMAGRPEVARRVGGLIAANTLGSILGSVATGYLLLGALGSEWTLRVLGLCFAAAAVVTAAAQRDRQLGGASVVLAGCVGIVVLSPGWDMVAMTNGANVYFSAPPPPDQLLFVREDVHGGLTSVARRGRVHTLYTNGKFQGDDGPELEAQRSFAHFPSLFVSRFDRALVIGLGTGTTLGTVASYPYGHIEVAETSPAVVEAARRFFAEPSRGSLDDPRVELRMDDGRNVLQLAAEPYDLITVELTSVWFAGAANLYSEQFYELCRRRLRPAGVVQQWVQLHHIARRELGVVLRTVRRVFPHVALFVAGGQGILVASTRPLRASEKRLGELARRPAVQQSLGVHGEAAPRSLLAMLDYLMASGPELDRFIRDSEDGGGPIVSTDENRYLEYATPKGNILDYHSSLARALEELSPYRTPAPAHRHVVR